MELSDDEKLRLAAGAFGEFLDRLGPNDVYKKMFLEVLLEEVYGRPVDLTDVFEFD